MEDDFKIGIFIGAVLTCMIIGVVKVIDHVYYIAHPENCEYVDSCLNSGEYRIDTIRTYSNGKMISEKYEFKRIQSE